MGSISGQDTAVSPVRALEHPEAGEAGLLPQHQEPWQLVWVTIWLQALFLHRS